MRVLREVIILIFFGVIWTTTAWSAHALNDSVGLLTLSDRQCFSDENFSSIARDLRFSSESDSLKMERVYTLLELAVTKEEKFKANLFAAFFYKVCDPVKAMYYFKECSTFESSIRNNEVLYAYNMSLGKLYQNMNQLRIAYEYLEKSVELAKQIKDDGKLYASKVELGVTLIAESRFQEAQEILEETLHYAESESLPEKASFSHFYLASIGFCLRDTVLFDYHRSRLHDLVGEIDSPEFWQMAYLIDFKEVELRELSVEERKGIMFRVLKSSEGLNDIYNLEIVSEYLSILYEEIDMKDSALFYLHFSDSINRLISDPTFYDYLIDKETSTKMPQNSQSYWFFWILGSVLIVVVLFIVIYKRSIRKNKKKLNSAEDTIEQLNSEIQERDASISQLMTRFHESEKGSLSSESLSEVTLVTKDRIDSFLYSFETKYPGFIDFLRTYSPDLNTNDINVVLLCVLKVDSVEQARILGIATASLRIRRYRMKKKLNVYDVKDIQSFSDQVFADYVSCKA